MCGEGEGEGISSVSSEPLKNLPNTNTVIKKSGKASKKWKMKNTIPEDILENSLLNEAIKILPSNYNFEIHKCVWKAREAGDGVIALQFPEGLLMYSCIITDIIERFAGKKVVILGDVTYGACCVDDFTANKLNAVLLIHYGHSCLVPVNKTTIKVLYVFVEIFFDVSHLISIIKENFDPAMNLSLLGTIQFTNMVFSAHTVLKETFPNISVPQAKPLSFGETLGCTSPILENIDSLVFVADGRFHLEAAMIQNPTVKAYRYDPYIKILTSEGYDTELMKLNRLEAIKKSQKAQRFGLILGTLGRQGSINTFDRIKALLQKKGKTVIPFLMAEIQPKKLELLGHVIDAWVQVACPRLSIDWGEGFKKPVLTPYELEVAMEETEWKEVYPMDYYRHSAGVWGNYSN